MMLDKKAEFSDAQSIVGAAAAPINSTLVPDLGVARDVSPGEDLWLIVQIQTTVLAAGGAANVTFKLVEDTANDLVTAPTILYTSGAIAKAALIAGYQVCRIKIPKTAKRYLGLIYTPDTNDTTAGKVDAFLVKDPDANRSYASGFSVL